MFGTRLLRTPPGLRVAALAGVSAAWVLGASAAQAQTRGAELLEQVRRVRLDTARAVLVEGVEIELGKATLSVRRGVLVPSRPVAGRVTEIVFVGDAGFRLDPPDAIEAGQLELFTGGPNLDVDVDAAVLLLADAGAAESLLARETAPVSTQALEAARRMHAEWLDRPERRNAGVEAAWVKALLDDSAFADYFAVWCRSRRVGDFIYQLDPDDIEPLTLANFSRHEFGGWDRRRMQHRIRVQQRKGRWLGLRAEDLGSWDVWMSSTWQPRRDRGPHGTEGFEPRHYELDVRFAKGSMELSGRARVHLEATEDGRRALRMSLYRDLVPLRVVDGRGRELEFVRAGEDLFVVLPEPSEIGARTVLEIDYAGHVLTWVGRRIWDLDDTALWYPHFGSVDRATYDVKLSWPRRLEVVASGRRIESGREGTHRWARFELPVPAIAFSFVLGSFDYESRQVGDVAVTLAFSRGSNRRSSSAIRRRTVDAVAHALDYFEATFGSYPLDHLSAVLLPRSYSQSYAGFMTLSDSVIPFSEDDAINWIRDATIAHEIAHQWWGNRVGWRSYRDQWLSEGMANYSALLYLANREREETGAAVDLLADMSAGWRESLRGRTVDGRTIESLGPVVLGARLNSSLSVDGYRVIVYRKGAVVLAMLARAVGEEAFVRMLHSLADVAANRSLTTESFIASIERMSGLDLEGFSRQFIYGTGIPEVYYDYRVVAGADGQFMVRGLARQLPRARENFRVVRGADGGWDVAREWTDADAPGDRALMVPYRVLFEDGPRRLVAEARMLMEGPEHRFDIEIEHRPLGFELDPRGEILAHFYSADLHPKRYARHRATDLALHGRVGEAEQSLNDALLQGSADDENPGLPFRRDPDRAARFENARIRLDLARLLLDQRRDAEVEAQLEAVDALLEIAPTRHRVERDALAARLELRRGDPVAAAKRLRKTLRQADPKRGRASWGALLLQWRLASERRAVAEAYALMAVACLEARRADDLEWALRGAREQGVEVGELESVVLDADGAPMPL